MTSSPRVSVLIVDDEPFDYLLKPSDQERFDRALDRVRPLLERAAGTEAADLARDAHGEDRMTRLVN